MKSHRLGIAVLLLLTTASCINAGARLLRFEIEVDGQVMFEGIRGVPDTMPVEQMWDVLGDVNFESAAGGSGEPVGVLTGKVVVRIMHVDQELARAALETLSLQSDVTGSSWSIDAAEADRVERAATSR